MAKVSLSFIGHLQNTCLPSYLQPTHIVTHTHYATDHMTTVHTDVFCDHRLLTRVTRTEKYHGLPVTGWKLTVGTVETKNCTARCG